MVSVLVYIDDFSSEELELTLEGTKPGAGDDDLEAGLEVLLSGAFDREPTEVTADGPLVRGARSFEFTCRGCFLIWHRQHLGDPVQGLCRDCADLCAPGQAA
jgi:hypothetical protein